MTAARSDSLAILKNILTKLEHPDLLSDHDIKSVIEWTAKGYEFEAVYDFKRREVGIMLCLPELYNIWANTEISAQKILDELEHLKEVALTMVDREIKGAPNETL